MDVDIIFRGGPIFTGVPSGPDPAAEAVAVRGDRIAAVGRAAEVMTLAGPRTEVVDLGGRLLLPGFIDAHCHLVGYGFSRQEANCRYPTVRSIVDIQAKIREKAGATVPGQWVRAGGYDQSRLVEQRHPTRLDLDAACPDQPVLLSRTCGHIAVANSLALRMAGVTAETPDPPGGKFDRDERGVPNGVIRETAWMAFAGLLTPKHEDVVEATLAGMSDYLARGITSIHEAGTDAATFQALREVAAGDAPKIRVYVMLDPADPAFHEACIRAGLGTGFGDEWLRLGPLKLMADGSSSGPTAATREPYTSDPADSGILYLGQDELDARFAAAHRAGFQVTAHAVGDRAVEMVITAIERAMATPVRTPFGSRWPRHRIEHCAMTGPGPRERIKALGIVPVLQPVFFHEFGDGYVRNYGRERASNMFTAGSYVRDGVVFALSTDCPVTSPDPMLNVSVAVSRRTMGGDIVGPEQRITVGQALSAYTAGAAYAAFEEREKGTIEPGKLADLVVLSGDPFQVPDDGLRDLTAAITVVGGKVVHSA